MDEQKFSVNNRQ